MQEVRIHFGLRDRQRFMQERTFGQAQQMTEEVGDGQAAGQVGQGDPKPVTQHGDGGDFAGKPGHRQGHHVAGQQFATGQNGQDQTDRKDRGTQQGAERALTRPAGCR